MRVLATVILFNTQVISYLQYHPERSRRTKQQSVIGSGVEGQND
jgi:hypothetical protein